jgi:general secretion pathway protein G
MKSLLILPLLCLCLGCQRGQSENQEELNLRKALHDMRFAIDQYSTQNSGALPESLDQLVQKGYLKEIPKDPFTQRRDTWVIERNGDSLRPGVIDVHTSASGASSSGSPYRTW